MGRLPVSAEYHSAVSVFFASTACALLLRNDRFIFQNMDIRESIEHQTTFSLQLAKRIGSALAGGSNVVFSPLSIHTTLSLLAVGSKGETLEQIVSVLRAGSVADLSAISSQIAQLILADSSSAGGPRLTVANGVWVDGSLSLKSTFKELVISTYKAEVKSVDFITKPALPTPQILWSAALMNEAFY
ncbi:hypothetical protein HPP92_013606, partial [Vanilla planifolia]